MRVTLRTKIPGRKSHTLLQHEQRINGGWKTRYPFVHSGKGTGCYFQDIDGNTFLDFASQISSNPLGYNHPHIVRMIKHYARSPLKYAGGDFSVRETSLLIDELLTIVPKQFNKAFLINSGAEAVENSMKIAMHMKPQAKFCISLEGAFHGRSLGALSLTNSRSVQKTNFFRFPTLRLPFQHADQALQRILNQEGGPEDIAFVIVEHIQGEGGYRIPNMRMIQQLRKLCKQEHIPYIADEVQAGMGRTGQWWSYEHFNIIPDIMTSAKALQVGAVLANKKNFPPYGSISSTWGGGHILDLATGVETIKTIKKEKLLRKNTLHGTYIQRQLRNIKGIQNVRGHGLMIGFDVASEKIRNNLILQCVKHGLVILGCGEKSIRIIPPYIITEREINEGIAILEHSLHTAGKESYRHKGIICKYINCGALPT